MRTLKDIGVRVAYGASHFPLGLGMCQALAGLAALPSLHALCSLGACLRPPVCPEGRWLTGRHHPACRVQHDSAGRLVPPVPECEGVACRHHQRAPGQHVHVGPVRAGGRRRAHHRQVEGSAAHASGPAWGWVSIMPENKTDLDHAEHAAGSHACTPARSMAWPWRSLAAVLCLPGQLVRGTASACALSGLMTPCAPAGRCRPS